MVTIATTNIMESNNRIIVVYRTSFRNRKRVHRDLQQGVCAGIRSGIHEDETETDRGGGLRRI